MPTLKKPKDIDITKAGPQSYRDLQQANREAFNNASSISPLAGIKPSRDYKTSASTIYEGYERSPLLQGGNDYWGNSIWDNPTANEEDWQNNLRDIRAENQPWYSQITNGLAKGAVLAGTTFLDGTIGLLFGAGSAISEGRWSALWDNDFSKAMQSINEWSEQVMPNYYTRQEQEGPWYENIFTANFIGDKFLKNLGFTVGAFYSGGLEAGLIKGAGRAIARAAKTAEAVKNITRATDMVASGVGSITSAVNEGRIEALNNSTDWYNSQKELINQAYESGQIDDAQYVEALAKANEDRLHMGNADLLMNLPILTASNLIQFGKMYANGMKTAKKGMNIIGNPGEWKSGSGKFLTTANAIKGALSEGVEEISQSAASRIAGNYYATDVNNFLRSKIDPDASQETLDWVKAFAQGINETVNDGSAWEEFFIGSLTGALGMPRARSFRNAEGKFQSPITIEGGIYNEIKESREKRIREQEVADYMNRHFNSPEFKNYYQGLIRHNKYQNDMNQAVENDDPFNFHNAEHAQLLSDIMMFDKAGKMQDLVEMVNGAFNTDDDNLESIAKNTQVDGNGPFMDNGNPMYSTEEGKKKMISQLEENRNAILDTIESYRRAKEDINNDLPAGTRLSDDQMEELAWIKTQIDDWNKRAVSMSGNIKQVIGKVIGDIEGSIAAWTAIRDKEGMEHADLTETYRKYDDKINSYKRVLNELNAARSMSDEVLAETLSNGANKGFIDGIKGELKFIEDAILSKEEKDKVLKQLDDINKLANGKKYFAKKYIEYVTNPSKQLSDHKKAEDKAALAEETKDNLKKKDFIDNTDVSSLVKAANAGEIDLNDLDSLVKADADSDVKDERTEKIDKAIGIIDELNALQDRMLSVANDMGVDPSIVRDAEALLQKQQESIEDASQLADVESEVFNDLENLANSAEAADEASLQQRMDTIKALVVNADQRLVADRDALEGMPTEIPEDLANADETIPEVGHDSVTPAPAVNGTSDSNSQDNVKPAFIQEALKDIKELMPNLDSTKAANAARKLGQVYEKLHSVFLSQGTISASFGNILAADTSFREVVDSLSEGNANTLLANRIKKYTNPQPQAQSNSPVTNPQPQNDRLVTPDISDTNSVESQLNKENTRDRELPAHDSTSSSYNYWKPTLTEFYIHSNELPRGQQMLTPEWTDTALKQGRITPQQARRIKAVHAFLSKHNAFASVNSGEVTINTKDATKDKPRVHFITSKELNTEAGEVVILIASDQGRIIGDLGSKNDRNTHKQVGLLDFIAKAEQEYYKKKDSNSDDLVPLSGSTSVLQNLIGSPKYTETGNRRTLNEIWEGKEFKLAVAASSGQNADMLMSGRSLRADKTDDEKSVISPLDAKAGQPYVLVTTSSMTRHYYPVPFTMPKFSSATKNSALGRAIYDIIKSGIESKNWEIIKGNAAKGYPGIPELLGVDKVSVSFKDNGNIKLGIQVNSTWHNLEVSLDNPNVVNTVVDGIANIGIPFQISRKYLNGTYGPTGQSYNQMIGELAQTNLPVGATHTVMDWFTLNPIGTDGEEQRGSLIRPTGVNPGTISRESRQGEIEVSVNGFTYYVDLAANKVRSATGEFTGTLADTCIAKARCIKQGWDGVSHKIYQCGIGWFDPVLNKWVPKPADAQEPTTTIETPSVPQTTADNFNLDSAIVAMADIDETATPENVPQSSMQKLAKERVIGTKLLHKEDIKDVRSDVDQDLIIVAKHKTYPDSLEVVITLNSGEINARVQPIQGITLQQGTPEFNLWNRAAVVPKEEQQKVVNYYVPEDLQNFIISGEFSNLNKESSDRGNELYSTVTEVGNYIVNDQNSGIGVLLSKWGIHYINNYSGNYLEEVDQEPAPKKEPQQPSTKQKISQVKANLLGEQEEIFDAMTPEQQAKLANFPNEAMINTTLERINTEIWDDGEFSGNVDDYLNTRFSLEDSRKYGRKWNERKEMAWLRKALPQLSSVEIARTHNGLIKVGNNTYAYGMFKNGIITIAEAAARGTLYHEAFHAVTWTLFTDAERKELFDEAKKQYGITNDLETEERLAEDFRRYVQIEETPVIGKVVRFFRRLKHMIMGLFGNEQYLDKVFYSINRGLYAGRQVNTTDTTRLNKYTAEEEEILRNAPRDSEGRLLAPNSKPSNLTERQYVQVRTKAFKDWFGDWENDLEHSSKVVDENGEPLVVYHGNKHPIPITEFREGYKNTWNTTRKGFFFTDNLKDAKYFADTENIPEQVSKLKKYLSEVFLNYKILNKGSEYTPPIKEGKVLVEFYDVDGGPLYTYSNSNNRKDVVRAIKDSTGYKTNLNEYNRLKQFENSFGQIIEVFLNIREFSKIEPYLNGRQFIADAPNQIKSATDNIGTFDPNNPDIRYSLVNDIQELEHLVDQVERERATMSAAWNKARNIAHKGKLSREGKTVYYSIGGEFNNPIEAKEYINRNIPKNIRDFFYVKDYMGSTYIYYTEVNANKVYNKYSDAKEEAVRALNRVKNNRDAILSEEALEEQAEYEQRIEQYHREKLEYGNLTDEQKEYLEMRRLSREEYNRMTDFEREVLFHCIGI